MIVVTAQGDRTGKVPGAPLQLGRITRNNLPIIAFAGRILDYVTGTFLELPVRYQTAAYGLVLCQAGYNECQCYTEEGHPKDEAAKSFVHDIFRKSLRRHREGGPSSPK